MMSSFRKLLFVAVLISLLHSSTSAGDKPPPGTYVELEIEYDTGKVKDAHLSKSTGDPVLDEATLEKFRKYRFKTEESSSRENPHYVGEREDMILRQFNANHLTSR